MLGIMKITWEEREKQWEVFEKAKKAVLGKKQKDPNVTITSISAGTLIRAYFQGISISVRDEHWKYTHRRVMCRFDKTRREWSIDLDRVRAKYQEMKKLAQTIGVKINDIAEEKKKIDRLISSLRRGVRGIRIEKPHDNFDVEIYDLKEEEVKKVVEFMKTLKKERR